MTKEMKRITEIFRGLKEGNTFVISGNNISDIDKEYLLVGYTLYNIYKGKVINEIQLQNREERYDFISQFFYMYRQYHKSLIEHDWSIYSIENINNNYYGELIYNYKNNPFKPSHYYNNYETYPELHYDNYQTYMKLTETIKYYKRKIDYYLYSDDNIDEDTREYNLEVLNEYYYDCINIQREFITNLFLSKPE